MMGNVAYERLSDRGIRWILTDQARAGTRASNFPFYRGSKSETTLPSFSVPGLRLVFVGDTAALIAFQPPLSGDQAPSSDAFERLTPRNAADLIIVEPAEVGNSSRGSA